MTGNYGSSAAWQDTTMVDLSSRLKDAMSHRKVDVAELAKGLGVSYQGIRKVLDGKTSSMRAETAQVIAKKLNVRWQWLLTGEGLMLDSNSPTATVTAIAPARADDVASMIEQLGALLLPLDAVDRDQAEVLLRKVALEPELAQEWGRRMARLLGEMAEQSTEAKQAANGK